MTIAAYLKVKNGFAVVGVTVSMLLLTGCQADTSETLSDGPDVASENPATPLGGDDTVTESGFPRENIDTVVDRFSSIAPSVVKVGDEFSFGTGWVLDAGHVLTNWHVVDFIQGPVAMKTFDGDTLYGTVIATDEFDDIAVIRLDQPTDLPPLPLASTPVAEGDPVFFIGHPGSMGDWMIGVGIVTPGDEFFPEFIRSTLPADPGASGSPMMNLSGEVVALISGCMGDGLEDRPVGDGSQVFSVIPGPPVADNCGGTEMSRVESFARNAIATQ